MDSLKQWVVVGNHSSCIAVVTLWSKKEVVSRMLDGKGYFLVGELVSFDGINALIRTIFSFPQIRYLVVCGQDRSGSGKALKALFEQGINKDRTVAGFPDALIDGAIPLESVELLRKRVQCIDLIGVLDGKRISNAIRSLKPLPPFSKPAEFPAKTISMPTTFPSWFNGVHVSKRRFDSAWKSALHALLRFGKAMHCSGTDFRVCKKLPNLEITAEAFDASILDRLNPVKEPGAILNRATISKANESILKRKKEFDSTPFTIAPKEGLQICFQVIENELIASASWNSCDMVRVFHAESHAVRKMQDLVARHAGLSAGSTHFLVSSAVLFESDYGKAQSLSDEYFAKTPKQSEYDDPHGNWVISVEGREIVAVLTAPNTVPVQTFRGKTARELFLQLDMNSAISDLFHAMDIGAELQKAEIAIRLGKRYRQDQTIQF